jgi:hypothetical protein
MTERRGIMRLIEALEAEARLHYQRMDIERISAEAKEVQIANLKYMLTTTKRLNHKEEANDSRNESRDQASAEVVSE